MSETLNAFSPAFLDLIKDAEWPDYPTSLEAGRWNGPWTVEQEGDRWLVRRDGGSAVADLELRETALMLAAILPIAFQSQLYTLKAPVDAELTWSLVTSMGDRGHDTIGHLQSSDDEILIPLHVVHGLLTHPASLAYVLQAAPPEVLTQAGELVARRWQDRQP